MKIQNALVSSILDRSQRYFAHVTTVTLSWRVQNIVVIGRVYFTLECFEFSSNFEFDRNMLSGTGARSQLIPTSICSIISFELFPHGHSFVDPCRCFSYCDSHICKQFDEIACAREFGIGQFIIRDQQMVDIAWVLVLLVSIWFVCAYDVFYHDMQISWPDSGSPPIRLSYT